MTALTIVMARWMPTGPALSIPAQADAQTYANLALKLAEQKYWSEAEQINQKALALQPYHPALHYNQGWLMARQGKWQEALKHLDQALSLEPENASARLNRAWVYQQLGQAEPMHQDLARYQVQRARPETALEQARRQQLMGEHAAAIAALNVLIKAQPAQLELYYWRSRSLQAQNKFSEAAEDLTQFLRRYPDAALYAERARLYLQQNDRQAAATDFERSLLLKDDSDVRLELVRVYLNTGQPEQALQQLLKVQPADAAQTASHALLQVEVLLTQNDLAAADAALTKALTQMPEQGGLWLLQARMLRQKRQYAAAEQAIAKATALGYRASRVAAELALLAAQRGQRESARRYVREALTTEPALKTDFQAERLLKPLLE